MTKKAFFTTGKVAAKAREEWKQASSSFRNTSLHSVILPLLGFSKSIQELEERHNSLPDNDRLLRSDWVKVVEFWKKYFRNSRNQDELITWILEENRNAQVEADCDMPHGSDYYLMKIMKKQLNDYGELVDKTEAFWTLFLISQDGIEFVRFSVCLFEKSIKVEFKVSKDADIMIVFITIPEEALSDPLTFSVLEKWPAYLVSAFDKAPMGSSLRLCFKLNSNNIGDHLTWSDENRVASGSFLSYAAELLRQHGVPVEGDLVAHTS